MQDKQIRGLAAALHRMERALNTARAARERMKEREKERRRRRDGGDMDGGRWSDENNDEEVEDKEDDDYDDNEEEDDESEYEMEEEEEEAFGMVPHIVVPNPLGGDAATQTAWPSFPAPLQSTNTKKSSRQSPTTHIAAIPIYASLPPSSSPANTPTPNPSPAPSVDSKRKQKNIVAPPPRLSVLRMWREKVTELLMEQKKSASDAAAAEQKHAAELAKAEAKTASMEAEKKTAERRVKAAEAQLGMAKTAQMIAEKSLEAQKELMKTQLEFENKRREIALEQAEGKKKSLGFMFI